MRLRERPHAELGRRGSLPIFDWLGISSGSPATVDKPPPCSRPALVVDAPAVAAPAQPPAARGPRLACRILGHRIEDHVVAGHRLRHYAPDGIMRCARCGQVNRRWQGWR